MPDTVVDPLDFRNAMARFASGVTVITTVDAAGQRWGFTASAFSSLSLDPPLSLVCLEKRAESYEAFMLATHFGVSFLATGQLDLAWRFATKGIDKFADTPIETGAVAAMPLVRDAAVHLECTVHDRLDGGDHTIIVGRVLAAISTDREPLVHYNRKFGRFVPEA
ncbi:MAG: flavin reductase family protein [Dehalococcoidia bacterium]